LAESTPIGIEVERREIDGGGAFVEFVRRAHGQLSRTDRSAEFEVYLGE